MKEIRIGIVGTGVANSIASRFARACAYVDGVRAAGVASRDLDKAARFCAENGVDRPYLGVDALVSDPEIDLVYVATPHPVHDEVCLAAIRAGKHVLCEKPMCISAARAEALFAEAKAHGVFLMEGMWSRFLPNSIRARQWVQDGRIGALRFIDVNYSFGVDPKTVKPRLVDPSLGGGAMFDLGVYAVEMASYYAGADPIEWSSFSVPYCPGSDAGSVLALRYPGEILATMRVGIHCASPVMMVLYGDKGRIELPRFFLASEARLYEGEQLVERHTDPLEQPEAFKWQIAAVRDYIREGALTSPVVPPETTIATARILRECMHRFAPDFYSEE